MGNKTKQRATIIGLFVLVVFAIIGIRSILGFESDRDSDQADQAPVATVAAEESAGALTPEQLEYLESVEPIITTSHMYLETMIGMQNELLADWDNFVTGEYLLKPAVDEAAEIGLVLMAWDRRLVTPDGFEALDAELSALIDAMRLYQLDFYAAVTGSPTKMQDAELQLVELMPNVVSVTAEIEKIKGEGQ